MTKKMGGSVTSSMSRPAGEQRVSKLQMLLTLLRRPDGASIAELATETGWQKHSVRGALAGSLKKKGLVINSALVEDVRRYRLEEPSA